MLMAVLGIHDNARIVGEAEPGLSFQIFREVGMTEVSVSSDEMSVGIAECIQPASLPPFLAPFLNVCFKNDLRWL